MKIRITQSLAALTIAAVTATGVATPASAATRATLKKAAEAVAYETVGGGNYAKYKAKYPRQLNWGHDGCSVPSSLRKYVKKYSAIFVNSCNRHDFGYRNFGKNTSTPGVHPKFSPTQLTKAKIDARFLANMRVNCQRKYKFYNPERYACYNVAKLYYAGVALSPQGQKAFFG